MSIYDEDFAKHRLYAATNSGCDGCDGSLNAQAFFDWHLVLPLDDHFARIIYVNDCTI